MENMFEKGCLVQLSISKWGGVKKIDKTKLAEMVDQADYDWVTATKKLVDPESLNPICKIGGAARNWLSGQSLPFPINGLVFVPKEMIAKVDSRLNEFREQFQEAIRAFMSDYSSLRETARNYLGNLFNETDYPIDISSKFGFNWRFIVLDVPNGTSGLLSPEVYEREKAKFVQTMEEARQMAIEALREEFAQMVERITERFTAGPDGKAKVFKGATVESFYEYFETFKERNIFRDQGLAELVERAQAILGGRSAEEIRANESLKDAIRSDMSDIEESMVDVFTRPRRKIIIN